MTYLCMIFFDPQRLDTLPPAEYAALLAEAVAYDEELRVSGHLRAAHRLARPHASTTVRIRRGHASPTDGPFAETKEQIGGVLVLEARDLNEAIQLASRMPIVRFGGVEVRPVLEGPAGKTQ